MSNRYRFVSQFLPKFYLLFTPAGLSLNQRSKFRPSSASRQVMRFVSTEAVFLSGLWSRKDFEPEESESHKILTTPTPG